MGIATATETHTQTHPQDHMALSLMASPFSLFDDEDFLAFAHQPSFAVMRQQMQPPLPHMDLVENDAAYTLTMDVPGIRRDELEVSVDQQVLTVSGKRSTDECMDGDSYRVRERRHSNFSRSLKLPMDAGTDAESVKASHKDGILELIFLKSSPSKRNIDIQ